MTLDLNKMLKIEREVEVIFLTTILTSSNLGNSIHTKHHLLQIIIEKSEGREMKVNAIIYSTRPTLIKCI